MVVDTELGLLCSVTIRLSYSLRKKLIKSMKKNGGVFADMSEAARAMLQRGFNLEDLKKIANDPTKKAEFESKIKKLLVQKHTKTVLEGLTATEFGALKLALQLEDEKRVKQLVLDLTR